MEKPRQPAGFKPRDAKLWHDIADNFQLRPDELRLLEAACRTLDELALIERQLVGASLVSKGSQGQEVAHPLLAAAVSHRRMYVALVKQLDLPDIDAETGVVSHALSVKNRNAANIRWNRQRALAAGGE